MAKYADITPFYEWLDWLEKESNSSYPEYNQMYFYEIRDKLDDLPELIRCKDCVCFMEFTEPYKHRNGVDGNCYFRVLNSLDEQFCGVNYEDYCSMGKRKEKEHEQ